MSYNICKDVKKEDRTQNFLFFAKFFYRFNRKIYYCAKILMNFKNLPSTLRIYQF